MTVDFQARDHVAHLTINRPEARNAVNGEVAAAMEAALDRYEADGDLWVAVLTGAPPVFSAGADLKAINEAAKAGRNAGLATERGGFAGLVQRVRTKPLIAAVDGPALAGGLEIALACDMIVAAENAFFGLPEVTRGLVPSAGGMIRLPRVIGPNLAMEIVLTGDRITARRAYEIGLVNRLVPEGGALEAALALARRIAENAPLAVQAARNLTARALTEDDAALWQGSADASRAMRQTEDIKEGTQAFIEKRAPNWRGR